MRTRIVSVCLLLGCLVACDGALQPELKQAPSSDHGDHPSPQADMGEGAPRDLGQPDQGQAPDRDMGSGGEDPLARHPNLLDQAQLFSCQDPSAGASAPRIRRMESYEWSKSIMDDNGEQVPLLPSASHAFTTYSDGETIDASILSEYLRHNQRGAGSWIDVNGNGHPRHINLRGAGSLAEQVRCFQWNWNDQPVQAEPSDACITQFVSVLLEHGVFFRPPKPEEVERLVSFTKKQLLVEAADPEVTRRQTIVVVVRAAWMMAGAIFRDELGDAAQADAQGRRKLSDWELAQALALALTDHHAGLSKPGYGNDTYEFKVRMPEVVQAAQDGTISDPQVIAQITRRYLTGTDPATMYPDAHASDYPPESRALEDQYWTSAKLKRFFQEWLGYAGAASVFKDTPGATSRFETKALFSQDHPDGSALNYRHPRYMENNYQAAQLARLLDNTIARIVAQDKDVLAELLTSKRFLVLPASTQNPYPATVYNHNVYTQGAIADDLGSRWLELPAQERAGVLTHPAWLAAHGGNFENDPSAIHRGKWVYEQLLCGLVPPVPITVDAMLDPATADKSARERLVTQLDERPECAGCHKMMNPLGYTFEIYNHAGFVRDQDHGQAPSGMATLPILPPGDSVMQAGMVVRDAVDLMDYLARSPRVKRCFIRQSFRYFVGRDETYADACALQQMEQAYDQRGSMIDMLTALFQSNTFLYRHAPTTQEQ